MKLFQHPKNENLYTSEDGVFVMKRQGPNANGPWGLFNNDTLMDTDQYRYDLAERNGFELVYSS